MDIRSRTAGLTGGVVLCLSLFNSFSIAHSAEPMAPPTLVIAYPFDENSFQRQALETFKKATRDSGVAKLDLVPARKLGDSNRVLFELARLGKVDLAIVPFDVVAKEAEPFALFTTPFAFEGARHLSAVQRGSIGQDLLRGLEQTGLTGVGWWVGEFAAIAGVRPALDPIDLMERRIGFQPRSGEGQLRATSVPELSKVAGAIPVELPPTPAEAALPVGYTELVEATPRQLQRTTNAPRFITLTNHLNTGYVVVANSSKWWSMPEESRSAVIGAFDKLHVVATDALQRQEDAMLKGVGDAAVVALSRSDRSEWRAKTRQSLNLERIGPLLDQAHAYPVTTLVSAPPQATTASWNAWLEDADGKEVAAFTVGRVARVNLNLSRLPFRNLLAAANADRAVQTRLSNGQSTRFLVQPILMSAHLEAAPGQPVRAALMSASLKNLSKQPSDDAILRAYGQGKLSSREVATDLGLGDILQWSVKATQEGCADIAFVVWDEARIEPLDHVVVSLPVRQEGGVNVVCYGKQLSNQMMAGLETFLRLPGAAKSADAALHVFEFLDYGTTRSVAVLVHSKRFAESRKSASTADSGVYSWELASALSAYVNDPGQLPKLVQEAHAHVSNNRANPYEDVASDLATVLFAGKTDSDIRQGALAKEALQDAVAAGNPSKVVMRLVNEAGKAMYLPLGVLAAKASKPVVSKRFTVIQSLGAPAVPGACVRAWNIARSAALHGVAGDELKLMNEAPSKLKAPATLMTTHEAVVKYLATQPSAPEGEGFIMLAHHDAGSLRFNPTDRPPPWVRSDNINRRFPAGSFGVLAACKTDGSNQQTSAIVNRLTRQGMSSIVLSPFAVDINYGVRLALTFEKLVLEEIGTPTGATVSALFERSAAEVAKSIPANSGLQDMSLEFQLVGDPDIKICTAKGS